MAIVRACGRMIPRLEAEESLITVDRLAIGTRQVDRHAARDVAARWDRTAHPARARRRGARATPEILEAMGIGVTIVEASS